MNTNQNNVEESYKSTRFKKLVDYFQTSQTNPNKNINVNVNPKGKRLSSNHDLTNEDLKNNLENEIKKADNIKNRKTIYDKNLVKEIIDINEEQISTKLSKKKSRAIALLENNTKSFSSKCKIFDDNMIDWFKKQYQKISKMINENNPSVNSFVMKIKEKISQILQIYDYILSSIKDQFSLLDIFLNNNLLDANFPLEEFIIQNHNLMINGNFLSKININSIYMNKISENKELLEIFQNYYLKRKNNYARVKNIKIRIKNINDLIATNEKIHGNENFVDKIKSICFENLNLTKFPIEKVIYNNIINLEKLKIIKCVNLYNTSIYKAIINNSNNLKMIKLEGIQLTNKSFNEFFSLIIKINSFIKTLKY